MVLKNNSKNSVKLLLSILVLSFIFILAISNISATNYISSSGDSTLGGTWNFQNVSADNINGIGYVLDNGIDIVTQINNLISQNYLYIKVESGTYTTSNELIIDTNNLHLDFKDINYYYNGNDDNVIFLNASGIIIDFDRIYNSGNVSNIVNVKKCLECRIRGHTLGSNSAGNATLASILINNTEENCGENIWDIGTILGSNRTQHAIYMIDTTKSYEGDTFTSKWIRDFTDTYLQIGDDGSGDLEYFQFNLAFDGFLTGSNSKYIETWHDKSMFILKEMVRPIENDITFKIGTSNNVVLATMSDLKIIDEGINNAVFSPNMYKLEVKTTNDSIFSYIENDGTNNALLINQDGVLASGKSSLYILNDAVDQTTGDALFRVRDAKTGSTKPLLLLSNSGLGNYITADSKFSINKDGTGTFAGNLSLAQKITFLLGEIIDNLVDGWIRITGGLNVTENLEVGGNVSILGNLTIANNLTIQGTGININSLNGITGNYTSGNCWTYYQGGIATSTNCTAL